MHDKQVGSCTEELKLISSYLFSCGKSNCSDFFKEDFSLIFIAEGSDAQGQAERQAERQSERRFFSEAHHGIEAVAKEASLYLTLRRTAYTDVTTLRRPPI